MQPRARGAVAAPTVWLCANAHGAVHALLDQIEDHALVSPYATVLEVLQTLPDHVWSRYTPAARGIAYHGWRMYGLAFMGGRYSIHYRFWRTDGSPRTPETPVFADLRHAARWSRRWRRELERL